jgi:inhibitor of cysteine peptidase
MAEIAITEANKGSTVSARAGDTLVIQLPEIPTTGFRWVPAVSDGHILELQNDDFVLAAKSGVGGGGLRVFRFFVKSRGSASLQFRLARAWESRAPSAVFEIFVNAA